MKDLLLVLVFLSVSARMDAATPQTAGMNLDSDSLTFSTGVGPPQPDTGLFRDPVNNTIGLACMDAVPVAQLHKLGIPDVDARLDALVRGHAIVLEGGKCSLAFPAIVGERRQRLQQVVDRAAAGLAPQVERMLPQIRQAVPERQEIVFHLLWSRVMDTVWDQAWVNAFGKSQLPDTTWAVYPPHARTVGTNYYGTPGGGNVAQSWSAACAEYIGPVRDSVFDLHRLAWGKQVPKEHAAQLQRLGVLDPAMRSGVFAYPAGGALDRLLDHLTSEYASALRGVYDYRALGKSFGLAPEQMFFILLHETAYSVFDLLEQSGKLQLPSVLSGGGREEEVVQLLSVKGADPPAADDEAMYLFIQSGWRGNRETVAKFREALQKDPSNLDDLLYLGMSLYETSDYRGAIAVFKKLEEVTAGQPQRAGLHDWARIWEGQMHDLLGERKEALEQYRLVLASRDSSAWAFSQFHIGRITAKEWARQRIERPFTRR